MNRTHLWSINIAAGLLALFAAWLALNTSELARPAPTALAAVDLAVERPPLPPAPFRPPANESADGIGRRDIFVAPAQPGRARAKAPLEGPELQSILRPGAAAPRRDLDGPPEGERPSDRVAMGETPPRPSYRQDFGGHFISPDQRKSDVDSVAAAPPQNVAPQRSKPPRPSPLRSQRSSQPSAAATTADSSGSVGDIILLGVFRSSGADRALVRLPSGSSRRLEKGDEVQGWRVSSIGDSFIELRRASQTRLLRLPP